MFVDYWSMYFINESIALLNKQTNIIVWVVSSNTRGISMEQTSAVEPQPRGHKLYSVFQLRNNSACGGNWKQFKPDVTYIIFLYFQPISAIRRCDTQTKSEQWLSATIAHQDSPAVGRITRPRTIRDTGKLTVFSHASHACCQTCKLKKVRRDLWNLSNYFYRIIDGRAVIHCTAWRFYVIAIKKYLCFSSDFRPFDHPCGALQRKKIHTQTIRIINTVIFIISHKIHFTSHQQQSDMYSIFIFPTET